MDLLKEVAKDRLVIMVTHNKELASEYSTRIIELKDGHILGDTNPHQEKGEHKEHKKHSKKKKKTNMSFPTAFTLSLNNLMTKKGRTLLTAFAGSIGIIGIALILSLSSGVQNYINRVQEETLTSYPLTIESTAIDMSAMMQDETIMSSKKEEQEKNKIYSKNMIEDTLSIMSSKLQANDLALFKKYIEEEKKFDDYTTAISYGYNLDLQLYKSDTSKEIIQVNPNTVLETLGMKQNNNGMMTVTMGEVWSEMFENKELNNKMYQIVDGRMPETYNEVVLLVNKDFQISDYVLYALGLKDQKELKELYDKVVKGEEVESTSVSYTYDELLGLTYKLLLNTDYYKKVNGVWRDMHQDDKYMKEKIEKAPEIKVVGIIQASEDSTVSGNALGGILYTKALEKYVIDKVQESEIVKDQEKNPEVNVITSLPFSDKEFNASDLSMEQKRYLQSLSPEQLADVIAKYREQAESTYESVMLSLGAIDIEKPTSIAIYAKDFKAKEEIKNLIAEYNQTQKDNSKEEAVINYTDLMGLLMSSVTGIVDMISYVLIGFVSISLVVSSIMIGIITYISVLERTKEIGILRAIGASKKDVSRVFNAETLIVGLTAGLMGILVTVLLNIPINIIINQVAGVKNISCLPIMGAIILVAISVILTMIAGLIPSRMASKKDPVESLRSE